MDVVRALVGVDGLQVHHVANDRVLVGDAVGAEDLPAGARRLQRLPDVVALRHGDVLVLHFSGVFEAADLQNE